MQPPPKRSLSVPIGFREFVILAAAMMSCQALAVDAMLPALSTIARELGVTDANRTQWVVTVYVAGAVGPLRQAPDPAHRPGPVCRRVVAGGHGE
jgi:hypothetical protein